MKEPIHRKFGRVLKKRYFYYIVFVFDGLSGWIAYNGWYLGHHACVTEQHPWAENKAY